jgi:hypothetical protein
MCLVPVFRELLRVLGSICTKDTNLHIIQDIYILCIYIYIYIYIYKLAFFEALVLLGHKRLRHGLKELDHIISIAFGIFVVTQYWGIDMLIFLFALLPLILPNMVSRCLLVSFGQGS